MRLALTSIHLVGDTAWVQRVVWSPCQFSLPENVGEGKRFVENIGSSPGSMVTAASRHPPAHSGALSWIVMIFMDGTTCGPTEMQLDHLVYIPSSSLTVSAVVRSISQLSRERSKLNSLMEAFT